MKELLVRALSGALYIAIILFSMYASRTWFLLLFFLLGTICLREFIKMAGGYQGIWRLLPYLFLAFCIYYFNYYSAPTWITALFLGLVLVIDLIMAKDLIAPKQGQSTVRQHQGKWPLLYLIGGFVFMTLIPERQTGFNANLIVGVFVLIWVNDSFAYLIGKNFGKRKLFPSVSPKKTIEGFAGGFIGSVLAGFLIFKYVGYYPLWVWLTMGLVVAILGTVGDLVQSKIKRLAGVKDSGRLMPGHGGLYDRLDSIIFVAPFVYCFLEIVDYVS